MRSVKIPAASRKHAVRRLKLDGRTAPPRGPWDICLLGIWRVSRVNSLMKFLFLLVSLFVGRGKILFGQRMRERLWLLVSHIGYLFLLSSFGTSLDVSSSLIISLCLLGWLVVCTDYTNYLLFSSTKYLLLFVKYSYFSRSENNNYKL